MTGAFIIKLFKQCFYLQIQHQFKSTLVGRAKETTVTPFSTIINLFFTEPSSLTETVSGTALETTTEPKESRQSYTEELFTEFYSLSLNRLQNKEGVSFPESLISSVASFNSRSKGVYTFKINSTRSGTQTTKREGQTGLSVSLANTILQCGS